MMFRNDLFVPLCDLGIPEAFHLTFLHWFGNSLTF